MSIKLTFQLNLQRGCISSTPTRFKSDSHRFPTLVFLCILASILSQRAYCTTLLRDAPIRNFGPRLPYQFEKDFSPLDSCFKKIEQRTGERSPFSSVARFKEALDQRSAIRKLNSLRDPVHVFPRLPSVIESLNRKIEIPLDFNSHNPNAESLVHESDEIQSICTSEHISAASEFICDLPRTIDAMSKWHPVKLPSGDSFINLTLNGLWMTSALESIISGDSATIASELTDWVKLSGKWPNLSPQTALSQFVRVCQSSLSSKEVCSGQGVRG